MLRVLHSTDVPMNSISSSLIAAAKNLSEKVGAMRFAPPVTHVYNPLAYAWEVQ